MVGPYRTLLDVISTWFVYVIGVDVAGSMFFFQAEDGIRDCLLSRGLGDVYKRQDYQGI